MPLLLSIVAITGSSYAQAEVFANKPLEYTDTVIHIDRDFLINTDKFVNPGVGLALPPIDFTTDTISRVDIVGKASIDGPESLNERLAKERAEKMKTLVLENLPVTSERVFLESIGEDWEEFEALVREDTQIPGQEEVLEIIASGLTPAAKEAKIKRLWKGITWRYLAKNVLPRMRHGSVAMHLARPVPPRPEPEPVIEEVPAVEEEIVEVVAEEIVPAEETEEWVRKMYIKTNAPAWALFLQNAAVEFDLARHWSVSLPVYWSPYDYGKQTLKFRTLAFVPEFRYWPRGDNMGFFVNAHFGMAYYNYAKDGEFRYQDHQGKTPALGGGIGIGYRFYFCRNHHWSIEAAVGAGIYKLDYDIFQNTGSTKDGRLVGRRQHTFYGIDQAALTFSYSFGLKKKRN